MRSQERERLEPTSRDDFWEPRSRNGVLYHMTDLMQRVIEAWNDDLVLPSDLEEELWRTFMEEMNKQDLEKLAACAPLVRRYFSDLRQRLEAAIVVVPLNNNQPRVRLRGHPVELVTARRSLADMRLPADVKDAMDLREKAITALFELLTNRDLPLVPMTMNRDLQAVGEAWALDVVPEIVDEVDAHRVTKGELARTEQALDEALAEIEALRKQLASLSTGR